MFRFVKLMIKSNRVFYDSFGAKAMLPLNIIEIYTDNKLFKTHECNFFPIMQRVVNEYGKIPKLFSTEAYDHQL